MIFLIFPYNNKIPKSKTEKFIIKNNTNDDDDSLFSCIPL